VEILEAHKGKPVLKLTWGKTIVYITANQGMLIGSTASGAIQRYEEAQS